MVKRKARAPAQVCATDRRTRSWTLSKASGIATQQSPIVCGDDGNDTSTVAEKSDGDGDEPEAVICRVVKKIRPIRKNPLNDDVQQLVDNSDFYLHIRSESNNVLVNSVGLLGTLEFVLEGDIDIMRQMRTSECWLYVAQVPHRSFVYYEWQHDSSECHNCIPRTLQQNGTLHAFYVLIGPEQLPDYELLKALDIKKYDLQLKHINVSTRQMLLDVYLLELALTEINDHNFLTRDSKHGKKLLTVMKHFLGIPQQQSEPRIDGNCDIDKLYEAVKKFHIYETQEPVHVQHASLLPTLRPYQVNAVRWMLARERQGSRRQDDRKCSEIHPLFVQVKIGKDGPTLYFNQYGGILTRDRSTCKCDLPGGILADEMGLGKTVEVIAAILCNPRPRDEDGNGTMTDAMDVSSSSYSSNEAIVKRKTFFECICGVTPKNGRRGGGDDVVVVQCDSCGTSQHANCIGYDPTGVGYHCPHCWTLKPRIPSRATLIVSPAAICDQWVEELRKHVDSESLKILVYMGVHGSAYIQPPVLADHDIVIMTYSTMRKEIDYVDLPHSNSDRGRRFRHPKRYMAIPSPLVTIDWWRICLDEAQMIECCMTKTADMVLRLSAVNRWCVTGTPIQKSVDDLYGLVLFLGLDPYYVRCWWKQCLADPYFEGHVEPLQQVISKVLWRSCKEDVLEQLQLPPQTEEIHWLSFTPIEEHFYRRLHLDCSMTFEYITRFHRDSLDKTLDSFDSTKLREVRHWLYLLVRLRQACCHPQVVRGRFVVIRKSTMTMEDLLDRLIENAKIESIDQHRHYIAALNGLAGIHIIKEEWCDAVQNYREVLRSARELRPRIETDKLPRLHALNNLIEVLEAGHEGIPPSTGDANLRQEAEELRTKYLEKCSNKVRDCREVLAQATEAAEHAKAKAKGKTVWWADILRSLADTKDDARLVDRVKQGISRTSTSTSNGDAISYTCRFRNCSGLIYVLKRGWDNMYDCRSMLLKAVRALEDRPSAEIIDRAVACHLKRAPQVNGPTEKCVYCKVEDALNVYEEELFSFQKDSMISLGLTKEEARLGPLRRGTWAGGVMEQMLNGILSFARVHENIPMEWIEGGQNEMKHLEALKKEFKAIRGVWMQLRDHVGALDELAMANTRLRVRLADEPRSDPPQVDVLEPSEVNRHILKLTSQSITARHKLTTKLGQLSYLENLAKSDYGKRGGSNPDQCPICCKVLGEQWCVMQCGHCFCVECIRVQTIKYGVSHRALRLVTLKCAVCRHVTLIGEVSHVSTKTYASEQRGIHVVGSHSTKVEAVVRKLLQIRADEPNSKTLVFSTWPEVLELLAQGLTQNAVVYRSLSSSKSFQANLTEFKVDEEVSVLLLPIHTGANGLNLIEATHVILFEPTVNPAQELQAINRVHRIGQTKPTVVHRFIIRNTIEEQMHHFLSAKVSQNDPSEKHNYTDEHFLKVRDLLHFFAVDSVGDPDPDPDI